MKFSTVPSAIALSMVIGATSTFAQETLTVDWAIPRGDNLPGQTAKVGETAVFEWNSFHNVYIHPTGDCSQDNRIFVGSRSPATYTFTEDDAEKGEIVFACDVGPHCEFGQIITFTVSIDELETLEPTMAPTFSPTLFPTESPTVISTNFTNITFFGMEEEESEEEDEMEQETSSGTSNSSATSFVPGRVSCAGFCEMDCEQSPGKYVNIRGKGDQMSACGSTCMTQLCPNHEIPAKWGGQ